MMLVHNQTRRMNRRAFLTRLGGLAALDAVPALAANAQERVQTSSNSPPRKVIVGTVIQSFWGPYPGLSKRLEQLTGIVDQMAAQAKQAYGRGLDLAKAYGRGLDLAILPETAVTGEAGDDAVASSVAFEGEVRDTFTSKAREHACYVVVSTYLLDSKEKRSCANAAILVGRKGEVVGTYRKVHLVVSLERGTMEGGATPGNVSPVFDCDFGKLGIQICYDMDFPGGTTPRSLSRRARLPRRSSRPKASWSTNWTSVMRCFRGARSCRTGQPSAKPMATRSAATITKTRIAAFSGPTIPRRRSAKWRGRSACWNSRRKWRMCGSSTRLRECESSRQQE